MPGWRTNLHGRNAVTRTDNFEESAMAETAIATRNEVTVVLLGQGESDYRARAQHYYHQAAVPCLALDLSSVEQSSQAFGAHLERALQSVTTAFVVLTLDADFVLPSALHSAAASLEQQPRAMAAQGYALGFVVGNAKVMYHKLGDALPALGRAGACTPTSVRPGRSSGLACRHPFGRLESGIGRQHAAWVRLRCVPSGAVLRDPCSR